MATTSSNGPSKGPLRQIVIKGARENNLKNVSLAIPREKLVVITGLSGSGKTSLAFDTLYAEGQRRYVECLSPYVRQFLEQAGRPEVDSIDGLSPTIAIEQRSLGKNPRSTVGTVTEIYDYLRLLYARVGRPHCTMCGQAITSRSAQQVVDLLLHLPAGSRFAVLAPVVRDRRGDLRRELEALRRDGFTRVSVDGEIKDLGTEEVKLESEQPHTVEVYIDRLVLKPDIASRLTDSVELALKLAGGLVKVAVVEGEDLLFSERLACWQCGLSFPDLSPRSFSFNNPLGACPRCSGLGVLREFDEELVVPHPELSLRQGVIDPWTRRSTVYYQKLLEALARQFGFDLDQPFVELSAGVRSLILRGSGEVVVDFELEKGGQRQSFHRPFEGVMANLERRLRAEERRRTDSVGTSDLEAFDELVEEFHRYMRQHLCPECAGARLRPEARQVLVGGHPIHQVTGMSIEQALDFFRGLRLEGQEGEIAGRILQEIVGRLSFLSSVGLEYLSLDRPTATLSGGEGQRVRLATQIGASLMGVLYILDEPSVGLHRRDHERLLRTLLQLRDGGNTVLVVEHDEQTIRASDFVVDLGPGAGAEGGEVVIAGTVAEVEACARSLTGQYLSGVRAIETPRARRKPRRYLTLRGASQHNLKGIDVRIPHGLFTCVTGVSGSGKSTLIVDTLLPALRARLHGAKEVPGAYHVIEGIAPLDKVIAIDQSPIGRTPRSNPATYTGIFGPIRALFAGLPESRVRGYQAGRYSFNVKGGRCEACQGEGVLRIAMHFLPDLHVLCESCGGTRYNRETLLVKYKGSSIAEVLGMTVDQAHAFLGQLPPLRQKLDTLREVGLGYLTLGQPANTLSGGEAQRLKLSRELARRDTGHTFFVLDEPTTGLHLADIHLLLEALLRLVKAGNTVVVIEHHLDVVKCADHVIDLGPEGGDGGGEVVAAGTPEEVAGVDRSHTGSYLRPLLTRGSEGLRP